MTAIQQVGLRVPDDVSVVELDGIPVSALHYRLASATHKLTRLGWRFSRKLLH